MQIRFGYELIYSTPVPTHMILMLHTHLGRGQQYLVADRMQVSRSIPLKFFTDGFGNTCTRVELPSGADPHHHRCAHRRFGTPEPVALAAQEYPVRDLPFEVLHFLLSSRYCDTEVLMAEAWRLFGHLPPGWTRVQAICDFVHERSPSITGSRDRPAPPRKPTSSGKACVATSRIWRSPSAAA